jgi:hypothetical protein
MEHFDEFIKNSYEKMSHPHWGVFEEQTRINYLTFQEICEQQYEGDLDEALDKYFRNELETWYWFSDFFETREENMIVDDEFEIYLEKLSVEDLKDILGLTQHFLK